MRGPIIPVITAVAALALSLGRVPQASAGAIEALPGCTDATLAANDDGSTTVVALPFTLNFFGVPYASLYVNNNGNVTFESPLSTYTPDPIGSGGTPPIIAPFWADVDTRGTGLCSTGVVGNICQSNADCDTTAGAGDGTCVGASGLVHFGATTFQGQSAFCVLWDGVGVGYFNQHTDKLNKFQLLLVDRSDVAAGDFDIIFNYDQVQWETGDASGGTNGLGGSSARAGYSNGGSGGGYGGGYGGGGTTAAVAALAIVNFVSFELPGSGVNGAFLDDNAGGLIHGSRDSTTLGRYVLPVRNGAGPVGGSIAGTVTDADGNPIANAYVQACAQVCDATTGVCQDDLCHVTVTGGAGEYAVSGLDDADYKVTAFPPFGSFLRPATIGPLTISGGSALTGETIVLPGPAPIPGGTTIKPSFPDGGGTVPVIFWGSETTLTTMACTGATVSYALTVAEDGFTQSGMMNEGPAGTYTATVPAMFPHHGAAHVTITITCPDGTTTTIDFDLYIDPSGLVRDTDGNPVADAVVTLFRSDSGAPGSFVQLPDGDPAMSPANRTNPDMTDANGQFGWDVIAGFYIVRAEKAGCSNPTDGSSFVETGVLVIPPPVTDLALVLDCPVPTDTPTPPPTNTPSPPPTNTPVPTNTATPVPTDTPTPVPTDTPTLVPTNTPTPRPTNTATPVPTNTPTLRPTNTPTLRPTNTATPVPTNTPTVRPTNSPTVRPTNSPTPASTSTPRGSIVCSGTNSVITAATINGDVTVPSGAVCTISGTVVTHDITVQPGGSLTMNGVTVGHDVSADHAASFRSGGASTVSHDMVISGTTGGANSICGTTIGHDLTVQGSAAGAAWIIGDVGPGECSVSNSIGHDATVQNNAGSVDVSDNNPASGPAGGTGGIGHDLTVSNNTGAATVVESNKVGHSAMCQSNLHFLKDGDSTPNLTGASNTCS